MKGKIQQAKRRWWQVATGVFSVAFFAFAAPAAHAQVSIWSDPGKWFILQLANVLLQLANFATQLLILLLGWLQPVLQYSDFIKHDAVTTGWEIVRNLSNTGLIAIMLVIAFGTMFGVSKVSWQQQVPRLVIAAIAVNFSRLIAGIFIDIGQVIMIAFVNALQQVGYANFFEMLQVRQSQNLISNPEQLGYDNVGASFATALFALMQMAIAVIVVGIMFIVLVYRIVILWVLIILSPAAFAAGAAQGMLSQAGGLYTNWWSKLTGAVMIGPILTFFLWLSLATTSTGGITDGFDSELQEENTNSLITNEAAGTDNILTYVIGIALLLAGLEIASTAAGQLGGIASRAVSGATSAAKNIVGAPAALAGSGAAAFGRFGVRQAKRGAQAGITGAGNLVRGFTYDTRQNKAKELKRYADIAASRGAGGRLFAGALAGVAGKVANDAAAVKAAKKRNEGIGSTYSLSEVEDLEKNYKGANNFNNQMMVKQAVANAVSDKDKLAELAQKDPKKAAQWLKQTQEFYDQTEDKSAKEKLDKMLAKNLHLKHAGDADAIAGELDGMSERDLKALAPENFRSSGFRKAMRETGMMDKLKKGNDQDRKGYNGAFLKQLDKVQGDGKETVDKAESDRHEKALQSMEGLTGHAAERAAEQEQTLHRLFNGSIAELLNDELKSGLDLSKLDVNSMDDEAAKKLSDVMVEAMQKSGSTKPIAALKEAAQNNDADGQRAKGMLNLLTGVSPKNGNRNVVDEVITQLESGAITSSKAQDAVRANAITFNGADKVANYSTSSGTFDSPEARRSFEKVFAKSPEIALNLDTQIEASGGNNELTKTMAKNMTKETFDGALKAFEKARGTAQESMQRKVIAQMEKVLDTALTNVSQEEAARIQEVKTHVDRRIKNQLI